MIEAELTDEKIVLFFLLVEKCMLLLFVFLHNFALF